MKILLVAPSWVGDMVMAHSLIQLLAHTQDKPEIHLLAPAASLPLAARMAEVTGALQLPFGHGELALGRRRTFGRGLRAQGFDWAIVLPNSLKSALVPWWAGIPKRTGWLGEQRFGLLNDYRRLDRAAYPLMIDQFLALALPKGAPLPAVKPRPQLWSDAAAAQALAERLALALDAPILALCPGAEFGPAKRWPAPHFAAVAAHWVQAGGRVWLFGSPADQAAGAEILAVLPAPAQSRVHNLAGATSLLEALDLLSLSRQVVTNDSGLMHLACALNKPVVALYGSTSPAFTPPLAPDAQVLRLGLDCSPCFKRECPLGHLNCLRQLLPAQVLPLLQLSGAQPSVLRAPV